MNETGKYVTRKHGSGSRTSDSLNAMDTQLGAVIKSI